MSFGCVSALLCCHLLTDLTTTQSMFLKQSHLQRCTVSLAVSYMEIYKDEVYDLLVTRENVGHPNSFLPGPVFE